MPPRRTGERPDPSLPEGTDSIPQIEHVIVVMMENHSYDNYLGMLTRGDGFTLDADGKPTNANNDANGQPLRAFHMANTCQLPRQPSQAWSASHAQYADGTNEGFVRSDSGPVAMGYWTSDDIPFYYGLAQTFPVCDRWFGSVLAQTYPNRRFMLAATALGTINNDLKFVTEGPQPPNGTIMDLLNRHTIPWRDYYTSLPSVGLYLPVLSANADKVVNVSQYYVDAAAGTLPAFCLVEPNFDQYSEENSDDITRGESFSSKVVNAAMQGPGWDKTMLIWCYDEHGGYYDHVPPPAAVPPDNVLPMLGPNDPAGSYDRYGFRVPAAVVSPYAKRDYVSHVVHDHTSILSFLETKFNLPALTERDAHADNLMDCLDLSGTPAFATPPTLPAPKNPDFNTPLCTAPGPVPNPAG
ncbi:MAG TPA: alkaline phosphatase family protein [Acidimicrobiales bacterium]|jgi:phospholipase C|nr:alkaline phosphatase family protein [Acidimicrobiales bacterium]